MTSHSVGIHILPPGSPQTALDWGACAWCGPMIQVSSWDKHMKCHDKVTGDRPRRLESA